MYYHIVYGQKMSCRQDSHYKKILVCTMYVHHYLYHTYQKHAASSKIKNSLFKVQVFTSTHTQNSSSSSSTFLEVFFLIPQLLLRRLSARCARLPPAQSEGRNHCVMFIKMSFSVPIFFQRIGGRQTIFFQVKSYSH
jgi:hypothetical protein